MILSFASIIAVRRTRYFVHSGLVGFLPMRQRKSELYEWISFFKRGVCMFCSLERAVERFREGEFVILVDDADRENEGDLIVAAQFVDADRLFFNDNHDLPTRHDVAEKMLIYIEEQMKKGVRMMSITRHILQLFSGQPGARHWRRSLGEASSNRNPDIARVRDLLLRPQLVR